MKRIICLLGCLLFFAALHAQQGKTFSLKGEIKGVDKGLIYLLHSCSPFSDCVKDSATIVNGHFAFKGQIPEPVYTVLSLNSNLEEADIFVFYMDPAPMSVVLDQKNMKAGRLTGGTTQVDHEWLEKQQAPWKKKMKPALDEHNRLMGIYLDAREAHKSNDTIDMYEQQMKKVAMVNEPYVAQMNKIEAGFIQQHPKSFMTAYLLAQDNDMPLAELKRRYHQLPAALQAAPTGKQIKSLIDQRSEVGPGQVAGKFSRKDLNGQSVSLSDYAGKYVLLDFWATWCVPCRAAFPHLKTLHAKYKEKGFEIIAVAADNDDIPKWKNAIEKDGTSMWKQLLDGPTGIDFDKVKRNKDNSLSALYNVNAYPTKFLIGPDGKIIGRYGEGDNADLDKVLAGLFP
jgi:thiol-disulfide isomerase/thioredoxin